MSETAATPAPTGAWGAHSLRLTVFTTTPVIDPRQSWWEHVAGGQPETRITHPPLSQFRDEGPFGEGRLALVGQLARVDWLYARSTLEDLDATLGPLGAAVDAFVPAMQRWLRSGECPEASRLAFGAVLYRAVNNRQDGYRLLGSYLPGVKLDVERMSDFLYQINRPRRWGLGPDELTVNRLMKWSVLTWRRMPIGVSAPSLEVVRYFGRLELDINTAGDYGGRFTCGEAEGVVGELVSWAGEIAEKGDVP